MKVRKIKCPGCTRLINEGDARCYCGHWLRSPFRCTVCGGPTTIVVERHQRHNDRVLRCAEFPGHMRFPAECGFDDDQQLLNAATEYSLPCTSRTELPSKFSAG